MHHVEGEDCYLVKLRVAYTTALAAKWCDEFGRAATIQSTRTTTMAETIKEQAKVPNRGRVAVPKGGKS